MLSIKKINTPSQGTIRLFLRKVFDDGVKRKLNNGMITAIGLIQGPLAEIIVAGDVAEKTSNVDIAEVAGNCPQHITIIGVFGDTSSVSEALRAIEAWEKQSKPWEAN